MTFPAPYFAFVFAAGLPLALGLSVVVARDPAHLAATAVLFVLLAALAVSDWRTETVPDALTLPLVATGLGVTALWGEGLAVHAMGAGLLLVAGVAIGRFTRDEGWVGSGDYFLLAGIVAWFGPILALEVALMAALVVTAACILTRRTRAALAPALAPAAVLIWMGGTML